MPLAEIADVLYEHETRQAAYKTDEPRIFSAIPTVIKTLFHNNDQDVTSGNDHFGPGEKISTDEDAHQVSCSNDVILVDDEIYQKIRLSS